MKQLMQHRATPQLTFAQARYANASFPVVPTFPAGCDLFSSLSNGDSIARSFLRVAVPTLSMVLLILWLARLVVNWLQWRQATHMAQSWDTAPNYAEALEVAHALQLSHDQHHRSPPPAPTAEDMNCAICFASLVEHQVALLPCGHRQFCAHCIVQLWEHAGAYRQLKCPLCRQPVELMCPMPVSDSKPSLDDIILLHKYNGGFCGAKKHSLLDRWVLRLRAVTNARLLPCVIGLRIAVLHATILAYIALPIVASDPADAAARIVEKMGMSDAAMMPACAAAVQALATMVRYAVTYADDLFVVAIGIILTGSLLQLTLFADLKL
ncbi:hypothetical protein ABL78_7974 [Leptomonas seymouri]|uniref:RING-type domain-containing protein n=1 Tax=Leptomonas seymouri TaxID=5684 RepID=A0A0N1HRM4_LEPSE|nr:hypothetical protein ABL78_7974 [Leptomonas seymouri]|eukprot:KPI83010.1 hypothetical protein ABL78_7974 [Leptomonas seymouri]